MELYQQIGYLSNIIGYIYDNKNFLLLNKKYNFNKLYALVSYKIINDYGYHNESLLEIILFIKNIYINDNNELIYEIDNEKNHKTDDIFNSKIKYTKEKYINDSCNLYTFIKKKYNLENINDYPQFIIEYTNKEEYHITELFNTLFINREITKSNIQEMNILKNQIRELQKELKKIECEEDKNILEDYIKKEEFIKSKLTA